MLLDVFIDATVELVYNAHKKKIVGGFMSTEWLSVEKIAEELDVPVDTVRAWIRTKKLLAYRPGREYRVKREDLNRFLDESRTIDSDEKQK